MTIKALAALAIIAGMTGCARQTADFQPSDLSYRRDIRTGICYAVMTWTGRGGFATVPCTPAVLERVPAGERPAT